MKLSIIIPCWNCSKTIERLLDSIVYNDLEKEKYEIIIVDDCSTDNFLDKVKPYENKANIHYFHTEQDTVHCPGNTRQLGLEHAKGEWITFIDNDDEFEPNIFQRIFQTIEAKQIKTVYVTSFARYQPELYDYDRDFRAGPAAKTWLHGKFYNKAMLDKYNIAFKKDLFSHEDLYFNAIVENVLYLNNESIYYDPNFFTYKWIRREDSLSNINTDNLLYIERFFIDYLYSTTEPYFYYINQGYDNWFLKSNIMTAFILGYFYYQAGIYRIGNNYPRKNLIALIELRDRMNKEAHITNEELIQYAYEDPDDYERLKHNSFSGGGKFIETTSLKDFILI